MTRKEEMSQTQMSTGKENMNSCISYEDGHCAYYDRECTGFCDKYVFDDSEY